MANELVTLENQLQPLLPRLQQALASTMPVERLSRTILIACERDPKLLAADRQSLFNAAMTFAVLGLEVDGVTGQGFLVPFKDTKKGVVVVQPIIGYLGYNTIAARAGITVTGRVVREGDDFDFDESAGHVHHKRILGGEIGPNKRRIIAAWAKAGSMHRPSVVRVLSADEILAVKTKSPRGSQPPWADPEIGYPAMAEKTAKRRLRRDMPMSVYQMAARMEEAHEEQGLHSWIHHERGVMVDDMPAIDHDRDATPTAEQLTNPRDIQHEARMAAERGSEVFRIFCKSLSKPEYAKHKPFLETLKPIVEAADNEGRNATGGAEQDYDQC